jgi:dihydropyrimidinase
MNPPIRTAAEHGPLWQGLRDGSIEFVSSDHAPTAYEHKQNFWDATVGIAGLQTWFPVLLTEVIDEGHLSLPKLVEVSSYNAAQRFQLAPRKGGLWPGADADIVVVDPDDRTTVRADELYDPSDYSVYEGRELIFPQITISRGEIVYEDGELRGEEGRGEFIGRPVQGSDQ